MLRKVIDLSKYENTGMSADVMMKIVTDWKNADHIKKFLKKSGFNINKDICVIQNEEEKTVMFEQDNGVALPKVFIAEINNVNLKKLTNKYMREGYEVIGECGAGAAVKRLKVINSIKTPIALAVVNAVLEHRGSSLVNYIRKYHKGISNITVVGKETPRDSLQYVVENIIQKVAA